MATFIVELVRENKYRCNVESVESQLIVVIEKIVKALGDDWNCNDYDLVAHEEKVHDFWLTEAFLTFQKFNSDLNELGVYAETLKDCVSKIAFSNRWEFVKLNLAGSQTQTSKTTSNQKEKPSTSTDDFVDFDFVRSFDDIEIPDVLIHGTDEEIESYPAFRGIFGRSAQIRLMAASIKTMITTRGQKRNHAVLHGKPGCAKSKLFDAWQEVIGKGGFLSINANSATKAGLESIFLERLSTLGAVPPIFFIEEMEKTKEDILNFWLSILDDRAEVQKTTHKKFRRFKAEVLCFATANDKFLFDRMMGGRPNHPGALSSRMRGIYVPRPNHNELKRILMRDIELHYPDGKESWADACVEIAKQVGTNDPRMVISFLDGRDRLLTGEYEQDILSVHNRERDDNEIFFEQDALQESN